MTTIPTGSETRGPSHRPHAAPRSHRCHCSSDIDRAAVEQALADLESRGFMLRTPIAQIWQGERDKVTLIAGLAETDAAGVGVGGEWRLGC